MFWEYDTRLGRRWNIDPVTFNWQSPFATFICSPILYNDPIGLYGQKTAQKMWNRAEKAGLNPGPIYKSGDEDYGFNTVEKGAVAANFSKRYFGGFFQKKKPIFFRHKYF